MSLEMDPTVEAKLNKALALTLRTFAEDPSIEELIVFKLKAWIKLATEDKQAFFDCLTEFDTPAEKEAFRVHLGRPPTQTPAQKVREARRTFRVIGNQTDDDSDTRA